MLGNKVYLADAERLTIYCNANFGNKKKMTLPRRYGKCVNNKNKQYKGRRCAGKINSGYKLMQADMHNLYPAIGGAKVGAEHIYMDKTYPNTG